MEPGNGNLLIALECCDYRFTDEGRGITEAAGGPVDHIKMPGAAMFATDYSDVLDDAIMVLVARSHPQTVTLLIINHHDCAAYGGFARFGGNNADENIFHYQALGEAKQQVHAQLDEILPNLRVITAFRTTDGEIYSLEPDGTLNEFNMDASELVSI